MHSFYNFVSGPLAWVAFTVFLIGGLCRLVQMLMMVNQKEKFIFTYMSFKYSFRSIIRWLIPFATTNWKLNPALTVATFAFHICLVVTPVFLMAHVILIEESFGISWWTIPDGLGDFMTIVVMICCVFFLVRRLTQPEVKFVTSASDFVILGIVAAPFVTGFLAYHQWVGYPLMMSLHVLSGEIMLAAIPFTRLSHMLFSPFTRAYMGSEFGKVRKARDW